MRRVSKRYTPPPPRRSQSFSYYYEVKIAFGTDTVNVTKVLVLRTYSLMLRVGIGSEDHFRSCLDTLRR